MAMLLLCLAFIFLCTLAGLLGSPPLDFSEPLLVRGPGTQGGSETPGLNVAAQSGADSWPSWE